MRVRDLGAFARVTVSAVEVEEFKRSWPCSGLPSRAISFTFDRRNGDLVEVCPANLEERGADGGALLALSHDAQRAAGL